MKSVKKVSLMGKISKKYCYTVSNMCTKSLLIVRIFNVIIQINMKMLMFENKWSIKSSSIWCRDEQKLPI